ncbi:hypothetical protein, partial [Paenibacillus validus]
IMLTFVRRFRPDVTARINLPHLLSVLQALFFVPCQGTNPQSSERLFAASLTTARINLPHSTRSCKFF